MNDLPFDVTDLINSFADCLGLPTSDDNFMKSFLDKLVEIMVRMIGAVAIPLAKLWEFITTLDIGLINEVIELLQLIISQPAEWLFSLINVFEDVRTPIPEISLGLFDLTIPGNKAYRDLVAQYNLTSEQIANKFAVVIKFIVGIIKTCFNTVWKYIEDAMNIITEINIDNVAEKVQDVIDYFAELVAPALGVIAGWIESLIGFFVEGSTEINRIKNGIYQTVVDVITGAVAFTQEMLDNLDDSLHPKIKQIVRFIICLLKFVVNLIIFLFSFSWL